MKLRWLASLALLLAAPAAAAPPGSFNLTDLDPSPGALWKLNRPVTLVFDQAVDLASVNPNTIRFADGAGVPAAGTFFLASPTTIVFQPDCPLEPDYSDAGFAVGAAYSILVPDNASGGPTVMSVGGLTLDTGGSSSFGTPDSDDPAVLFDDTGAGAPQAVVRPQGSSDVDSTYLELGGDSTQRVYFERDGMGNSVLPASFLAPLNLYAHLASRVAVMVELDQGVSPLASNFTPARIRLEYLEPGSGWRGMASEATLVRNCAGAGATVRVEPRGVLPQGRSVRVNLSKDFADLVGQTNYVAQLDFGVFPVSAATDTDGTPLELSDEVRESFWLAGDDEASLADESTPLPLPRARWGGGRLEATTGFEGTSSDFDWHVPPDTTFVLDTTYALILGGPGGVPTTAQEVIDGQLFVRDLYVPASSQLLAQGPNPLVVWATGEVRVDGLISCSGGDARSVPGLDTEQIPEPGAPGHCGGGTGGTASWRTTTSTERGGAGFGAFGQPGLGGEGGESGWSPNNADLGSHYRAAGGGGGRFAADVYAADGCIDQTSIGLDAESGFPGALTANAATRPGEEMPWGGHAAPNALADEEPSNDFWGTQRFRVGTPDERLILGELATPWAGSGGGGGGDGVFATSFPAPYFPSAVKGAGGGGGGGVVHIRAIGRIVFGPAGRVEAKGGHGGGGQNTTGVNRIGGGSGGGAGGHVILESLEQVDLSAVPVGAVALLARGGQGGVGGYNAGGANNGGESTPLLDANHAGVSGPGDLGDNPWIEPVPLECQAGMGIRRAAGGDGGPGLVQIHTPQARDILPPGGALANRIRPSVAHRPAWT